MNYSKSGMCVEYAFKTFAGKLWYNPLQAGTQLYAPHKKMLKGKI